MSDTTIAYDLVGGDLLVIETTKGAFYRLLRLAAPQGSTLGQRIDWEQKWLDVMRAHAKSLDESRDAQT